MPQTNRIIIKTATDNDLDEVLHIQSECQLSAWSKKDYAEEVDRRRAIFTIARRLHDDQVLGFTLSRLIMFDNQIGQTDLVSREETSLRGENPFEKRNPKQNTLEIHNIGVAPIFQKQGIGTLLLENLLERAALCGVRDIWLEVRASNSRAIAFYEKHKFQSQYRRPNYYANPPESALVMRRVLNY